MLALVLVLVLTLSGLGNAATSAAPGTVTTKTATASGTPAPPPQPPKPCCLTPAQQAISDAEWAAAEHDLGLDSVQFIAALKIGTSVDQLATEHQTTTEKVRADMVAAGRDAVAAALRGGAIDQAEADTLNNSLVTAIADKVTHANVEPSNPATPTSGDKDLMHQKSAGANTSATFIMVNEAELHALATKLGVSDDQIKADLAGCLSVAALNGHSADQAQIRDVMVAAGQSAVDAAVQRGQVTPAQADQLRQSVVTAFADKVSSALTNAGSSPSTCSATPAA